MKVTPVRFTADVAAMQHFCAALGLSPRIESVGGGWVEMAAHAGGSVGLHTVAGTEVPRSPGETVLSFEADEPLEPLADRLRRAGFEPVIVDEAYGRSLRVLDPDGVSVQVNEAMTDDYGYRVRDTI